MRTVVFVAVAACLASAAFNDSLSRFAMLPLAAAAYSDEPEHCLVNQLRTTRVHKQVTLVCDHLRQDTCSAFTFFDEKRRVIGISFRGTNEGTQFLTEITDTLFEEKVDFQDGGKTSKYFNDAFVDVWNGGIGADFLALTVKYPTYSVWITGHSLGGALASLTAAHISASKLVSKDRILLYTFGQPRTGDKEHADAHDTLVTSYRVIHSRDIITHLPPRFMNYHHHMTEVWYDNDMAEGAGFVLCWEQEDEQCSNENIFNTSFDNHQDYYGVQVNVWGLAGCP